LGKKAIQSSELREVGKKIISCQNTSRVLISAFLKYREENPGKKRLETSQHLRTWIPDQRSHTGPGGEVIKQETLHSGSCSKALVLIKMHPKRMQESGPL